MATMPGHGLRRATATRPWLTRTFRVPSVVTFASLPLSSSLSADSEEAVAGSDAERAKDHDSEKKKKFSSTTSYFPKRGQTLELVCESLAFKGKGLCKVADTGFVVLCDRALPGERFVGRVSRKKGNYAEVRMYLCICLLRIGS